MRNYYCNTCGRETPHKRFFHSGSSVAAYATGGLWLLARPLYPLRCIICGNKLGDPSTATDTHPLPETLKKCPLCAETIRSDAKKCRFCGHLFDPEEVEKHVQALKAEEAGLKKCPSCGNWDAYWAYVEDGGMGWWCPHCKKSVSGDFRQIQPSSSKVKSEEKKCPLCAETIRLEAVKCRFCGHLFDPEQVDTQIQVSPGPELHTPEDVGLKQVESSIIGSAFVGGFLGGIIGLILGGIIAGLGGPTIISVMVFLGAPIAGIIIMIRLSTKD